MGVDVVEVVEAVVVGVAVEAAAAAARRQIRAPPTSLNLAAMMLFASVSQKKRQVD